MNFILLFIHQNDAMLVQMKKNHLHLILDAHIANDPQNTDILCTKYIICLWTHLIVFDSVCFKIPQSIFNSPTKDTKNYHVANVHPMFVIDQFFPLFCRFPNILYCKLIRTQMRNMFVMSAVLISKNCANLSFFVIFIILI